MLFAGEKTVCVRGKFVIVVRLKLNRGIRSGNFDNVRPAIAGYDSIDSGYLTRSVNPRWPLRGTLRIDSRSRVRFYKRWNSSRTEDRFRGRIHQISLSLRVEPRYDENARFHDFTTETSEERTKRTIIGEKFISFSRVHLEDYICSRTRKNILGCL